MSTTPFVLAARRNKPNPLVDGSPQSERGGSYGEAYVLSLVSTKHLLADEGSYFTACMTPGQTPLAYGVSAVFSDTAAFIVIGNGNANGGPRVYPDYLKMNVSTAPASSTAAWMAAKVDNANRTPTANFTKISQNNGNMDVSLPSAASIWFPTGGTLTVPGPGASARLVFGNLALRTVLPTVNDEYVVSFGTVDYTQAENAAVATATAVKRQIAAPPVVIGGGQYLVLHLWFPSNAGTGASFNSLEFGYWER